MCVRTLVGMLWPGACVEIRDQSKGVVAFQGIELSSLAFSASTFRERISPLWPLLDLLWKLYSPCKSLSQTPTRV